jgi:peptidyl-prolyl cis-trans isomerase B (cyclophilin B)
MFTSILLLLVPIFSPQGEVPAQGGTPVANAEGPVRWEASELWIAGAAFEVSLSITAPADGMQLPLWALTGAAFDVNGKALGERPKGMIALAPGQVVETRFDLTAHIEVLAPKGTFSLACALPGSGGPIEVLSPQPLVDKIDFMEIPVSELAGFEVIMLTNRGALWFELWPDVAPNHVRNFLDLASSGFYDGSHFHRVVPGFMIQGGGAPPGKTAPRKVKAEFNSRKHGAGILSAARFGNDIDSATSQFFVMHRNYPSLNGRYSPYGKLKSGMEVVEKIVITGDPRYSSNTPQGFTPTTPQNILRAIVVRAQSTVGEGGDK